LFRKIQMILFAVCLAGVALAQTAQSGIDYSDPMKTECTGSGVFVFTCDMMKTLLAIGPMVAVLALVLGGIIYVYANAFVPADQRGKYHSLAVSLVVGALILAALVGSAGTIIKVGSTLLSPAASS